MSTLETQTLSRKRLAELLAEARARTILLVSSVPDESIDAQPEPEVKSVLQELDDIMRFEEQWLARGSDDPESRRTAEPRSYDEWFDAMIEVRERTLERLESVHDEGEVPSIEHRCRLVLEHEYRRGEAILETLQLQPDYRAPRRVALPRGRRLADPGIMVRFPGGTVSFGLAPAAPAWPDEAPPERAHIEPFWMDVVPVTNGDFITFMAVGGYMTVDFWSPEGWDWVRAHQVRAPRHWFWEDGAWWTRWMDLAMPLDLTCPVSCVSRYEAEAFARFVGKRLPSELEWEAAASWDPETQERRDYPWGRMPPSLNVANVDQLAFAAAEVGAFPGNLSPVGCYGMIGDLWEWTAGSALRGGSWATRPGAARVTARKPAAPSARHLFSGFRCAHDA